MKRLSFTIVTLTALAAAGAGGYWAGQHGLKLPLPWASKHSHPAPSGPVIYYQDPDGKPSYSAEPRQTADGRAYRAVHAGEDISFNDAEQPTPSTASSRKILYYRNPMGLPDISKTPKKDAMGMDYIAVYEGEETDTSTVTVSPGKLQRIGVKSEPAASRILSVPIRAPGTIQLDERRISVIALRAEAFVESVENVTSGTMVRKGQPLMRVYIPAVASAAADYAASLSFKSGTVSIQGSRQRLLNYDAPPELLSQIEQSRQAPVTFTTTAPREGIVLERNVSDGMRVAAGDTLFRIADHSVVWAIVDVAERDLALVREGQAVALKVRSYPDRTFPGKVALVYPHLNPATRTVKVRIELPNPDHVLLPDMYAEAAIDTGGQQAVIAVPDNAVIDSGDRQVVIIDRGEGRFEPRQVQIGRRGPGYVEVKEGVVEGDHVVTSANFLIDAESNLKAALRGLTDAGASQ
jgi:Cu(I)/Ag(I) efflux system membrane fusion protein